MSDTKAQRTSEEKEMNTAREQSMKTFEDLYAEPPPYSSRPSSTTAAPSRSVPTLKELNFQPSPLEIPTPAECIAHLKLLHTFAKLRHEVGNHEGLFGIRTVQVDAKRSKDYANEPSTADGTPQFGGAHEQDAGRPEVDNHGSESASVPDAGLAERVRDKRWSVFVAKAVARFEKWWDLLQGRSIWYRPIRTDDFEAVDNDPYAGECK